jgi:hypothetical protein
MSEPEWEFKSIALVSLARYQCHGRKLMDVLYAHTAQEGDDREWQRLDEHLNNTADCAEEFASDFGAGTWGRALGMIARTSVV